MTDNELLLVLSSLIDEKIKAGYAELKEELKKELKEEIRSLGKEVRRNSIIIENEFFQDYRLLKMLYIDL